MQPLTAVVLCGGRGDRLRPFTDETPKPLVPLNGRPILGHLLNYLLGAGVSEVVLCVGYKAEAIRAFVAASYPGDGRIVCVDSGDASITDRLRDAADYVSGRSVICYGDTLANVDIAALTQDHEASAAIATLSVYPLHSPFGVVEFENSGLIRSFREKPVLPHWINIGFLLCERSAYDFLRPQTDMPDFLTGLANAGCLHAYRHDGQHLTVNTEKERESAEEQLMEFYTVPNQ